MGGQVNEPLRDLVRPVLCVRILFRDVAWPTLSMAIPGTINSMISYFYPLWFSAGLGGALLLLGIASFARFRPLHKSLTTIWLTVMACLWLLAPVTGRWMFSVWSPAGVLGGQVLLEMTPGIWWCGFTLAVVFAAVTWGELVERRETLSMVGPLLLSVLLIVNTSLAANSLLTTLAAWAMFDLLWSAVGLTAGAGGERVTLGLTIHGIASIILWSVSLLLLRAGESGLWWLMWPSTPMLTLLLLAAGMRMGFFPFQIVFPPRLGKARALNLTALTGPLMGVGLLHRIMSLPGMTHVPDWMLVWGVFSVLWNGVMVWTARRGRITLRAWHTVLLIGITGACAAGLADGLLLATSVWIAVCGLLMMARPRDSRAPAWSWPAMVALLFAIGTPPSPLGPLCWTLLAALPWSGRLLLIVGGALTSATLLGESLPRSAGATAAPWPWLRVGLLVGLSSVVTLLLAMPSFPGATQFSWLGLGLWLLWLLLAVGAARWRVWARPWRVQLYPFLDFLDLQWFFRAMWRGMGNLLGVVRLASEVVEGSGAMVWSLLIMLLVLLVVMNR